jgi:hypothetical protein
MGNGEQAGSSARNDWRVRIAGGVGAAITGGLALLVMSLADMHLFPFGMIVFLAAIAVGLLLGQRAGSRLLRRPPGS